jgi:RNA polymerase sigma-70 factor (ECF subfamily)
VSGGASRSEPASADCLTCRKTLAAAQAGDRSALAQLLTALQDPWYRLSLSLLREPDLAADAVQETGLRFLKQVSGFRGDSQLRTWSLGIAINVARELKRRRGRAVTGLLDENESPGGDSVAGVLADDAPAAHERVAHNEQCDALSRILNELPGRQREAVLLRFFEDLSVEETARLMGCAAGTVKATVHQALRSLRKRLSEWI